MFQSSPNTAQGTLSSFLGLETVNSFFKVDLNSQKLRDSHFSPREGVKWKKTYILQLFCNSGTDKFVDAF